MNRRTARGSTGTVSRRRGSTAGLQRSAELREWAEVRSGRLCSSHDLPGRAISRLTQVFLNRNNCVMDPWSSADAARELGLSERRVRALAEAGRLKARKVGSRWLVEPVSARQERTGRPLATASAWAILAILSGARPDWLHPSAASRLKRRLRDPRWVVASLQSAAWRASVTRLRVLPADIAKVLKVDGLVLTGLSAVTDEIDLVPSSNEIDAYVSSDVLRMIERQFRPDTQPDQPNLTLRVPSQEWVLHFQRAPVAVAAADLLLSPDPRASRAGREALQRIQRDRNS
jgi:hypothetical protein